MICTQTIVGNGRKLHYNYQWNSSDIAAEGLRHIAPIYRVEASVRRRVLEENLTIRQQKPAALVADFGPWLPLQHTKISTKSCIG